jgi:hypothetical protein
MKKNLRQKLFDCEVLALVQIVRIEVSL